MSLEAVIELIFNKYYLDNSELYCKIFNLKR